MSIETELHERQGGANLDAIADTHAPKQGHHTASEVKNQRFGIVWRRLVTKLIRHCDERAIAQVAPIEAIERRRRGGDAEGGVTVTWGQRLRRCSDSVVRWSTSGGQR